MTRHSAIPFVIDDRSSPSSPVVDDASPRRDPLTEPECGGGISRMQVFGFPLVWLLEDVAQIAALLVIFAGAVVALGFLQ